MSHLGPKAEGAQAFVKMLASIVELKGSLPDVGDLEHPLARQFPLMPENELEELAEDIRENDLHEKIVIYAGKILDGRNRYFACKLNGRQFTGAEFCDYDEFYSGDPELYVISRNNQAPSSDVRAEGGLG